VRMVRAQISTSLVEYLLNLPPDVRIAHMFPDVDGHMSVLLEGKRFAEVPDGESAPLVMLEQDRPSVRFVPSPAPRAGRERAVSEHKHTPGPWTAIRRPDDPEVGREGEWIVLMGEVVNGAWPEHDSTLLDGPCGEANARLIAAAPDLLAACTEALDWMTEKQGSSDEPCGDPACDMCQNVVPKLRADLSRALAGEPDPAAPHPVSADREVTP
jgi:hypothetical protein